MPLACAGAQRTVLRLLTAPNPKVPVKGGWEERLHRYHEIDLRGGVEEEEQWLERAEHLQGGVKCYSTSSRT